MLPAHSKIGASSAKRWLNCPGSVQLSEHVPPEPTSKYAAEGTVAHNIAEQFLTHGCAEVLPKDNGQVGEVKEQDDFKIKVDVQMIEACETYVKTIFEDIKKLNLVDPQLATSKMKQQRADLQQYLKVEQKFHLKSIDDELFGTSDAILVVPFVKLIVYDFKYGAGVAVDVEDNEQLMFYALGAAEAAGGLDNICVPEIELVITQPRAIHADGPIRRWTTTPDRLKEFAETLRVGVSKTRETKPEYKSGSWCKWCKAKIICNAIREEVNNIAQMDFAPVQKSGTELSITHPAAPPEVGNISPEVISKILKKASIVKDFITAVETHALEQLKLGTKIPGYKLVQKKGNRVWVDEITVSSTFYSVYGDDIYICPKPRLKSPAQLEKIIGKDIVKDYVEIPDKGFTVVESTDKRQEVVPAQSDFETYIDL